MKTNYRFDTFLAEFEENFKTVLDEACVGLDEKAPPGMEGWIKKNKKRFQKEYGKKKGLEVLYATAWNRYNAKESIENNERAIEEDMRLRAPFFSAVGKAAKKILSLIEQTAKKHDEDLYDTYVLHGDDIMSRVVERFNSAYSRKYGSGWDNKEFADAVESKLDSMIYGNDGIEEEKNDAGGRYATMDSESEDYLKGQRFVG